ncbi:MAG: hypothetical protein V2I76_12420 [Roseobacter sp.]|nr:hypothetical protein [Roseobacter sp.]
MRGALIGGRISYSNCIDETSYDSSVSLSVAARLSYNGLIGKGQGAASAEQKLAAQMITSRAGHKVRALGGDKTQIAGKDLGPALYNAWVKSVPENMAVVDIYKHLETIDMLVQDKQRRKRVTTEIQKVLSAGKWPADPDMDRVQSYNSKKNDCWYFSIEQDAPAGFGPTPHKGSDFWAYTKTGDGRVPIYRLKADSDPERYMLSPVGRATIGPMQRLLSMLTQRNAAIESL